jgi:hypothetical protein
LLRSTIDRDVGARVDDFIALNENGVFLGRVVGVYPKASLDELTAGQVLAAVDQALQCGLMETIHGT